MRKVDSFIARFAYAMQSKFPSFFFPRLFVFQHTFVFIVLFVLLETTRWAVMTLDGLITSCEGVDGNSEVKKLALQLARKTRSALWVVFLFFVPSRKFKG